MNDQAHPAQHFDVDFAPALKMYQDTVESWRKNYEKFLATVPASPAKSGPELLQKSCEQAAATWQHAGGDAFKRLVEQQVELCRFFARRWELYLDLPEKFARCRTPLEFGQLQLEFLNRMNAEYLQESARLVRPVTELMTSWAPGR